MEKALTEEGEYEVDVAIRRIPLIHGLTMTVVGIPLLYLGDEIATLNDYSYLDDPAHNRDSRWVHRSLVDWERYERRNDPSTVEGRVYNGLKRLIALRKNNVAFSDGNLRMINTENEPVLAFIRSYVDNYAVVFANFSETPQGIPDSILEKHQLTLNSMTCLPGTDWQLENYDLLIFG